MVKKVVYRLASGLDAIDMDRLNDMNAIDMDRLNDMSRLSNSYKRKLTEIDADVWYAAKCFSNEYESIFTNHKDIHNVATYHPISRSFFKMWEMLQDFHADIFATKHHQHVVFLAEGPGGFIEAYIRYCLTRSIAMGHLHCMTLINRDRRIPHVQMRKIKAMYSDVHIHAGVDNTGNLYNVHNIDHIAQKTQFSNCALVTADGGFDMSSDYDNSELSIMRLLCSEVYGALRLQKIGGCFVLKVFDMYTPATNALLFVLYKMYTRMHIVKPMTSRPANSEKYIVCVGFVKPASCATLDALRRVIDTGSSTELIQLRIQEQLPPPTLRFLRAIIDYSEYFLLNQIVHLEKALMYTKRTVTTEQKEKCEKWCDKYHVPRKN